jgi:hypothetical protein
MSLKLCPTCKEKKIDRASNQCLACYKSTPKDEPISEKILRVVRRHVEGISPEAISQVLNVSAGKVLDELIHMRKAGKNLHVFGDRWSQTSTPETGGIADKPLISDKDGWHIFGACGDSHLCSKQERLDALHDLYRVYDANGIKTVLHTGNYIDGECRFNKHEINVHGMDAQLAYLGENYPEHKGITTRMVSGDDHEGWYAQREGVDIGRYMESVMRRGGRTDIQNLGYMECFVPLQHKATGKQSMCHVIHPGGGSAYAISYTSQKQIESYEGGEKPAIALIGHYHKAEHLESRNVHAFQTGCTEDQTVFMRKKKLVANIGGWIILARQNPETGAIEEVVSYFKSYFNRGYYVNQRWSLSGPVTQVPRLKL